MARMGQAAICFIAVAAAGRALVEPTATLSRCWRRSPRLRCG